MFTNIKLKCDVQICSQPEAFTKSEYSHVFSGSDRMELIKSEARLAIRSASRPTKKEKVMALAAAENPHLSRLAGCLLKTNVSEGQGLKSQLVNIQRYILSRMFSAILLTHQCGNDIHHHPS